MAFATREHACVSYRLGASEDWNEFQYFNPEQKSRPQISTFRPRNYSLYEY